MTDLPEDYQDETPFTGALTKLPATGSRGLNRITGRINANARAISALPANIYYAQANNLVGNWTGGDANTGTGTNDTAALNALIAAVPAGSTIMFDGSKTYRLDPLSPITKTLTLDFNGASVVTKTMAAGVYTAGTPFIRFVGALSTARAFGTVALWDTSLTTTTHANAGDFAAGDYVFVFDNFVINHWQDGSVVAGGRGEINIVSSANSSTGVVGLEIPMSAAFTTTPTIQKFTTPIVGAAVKNIEQIIDTYPGGDYTGTYGPVTTRPNIIEFDYCVDPLVENVFVKGWVLQAVSFARCMRPRTVNLSGSNPFSVASGHGYLGSMYQCSDGLFYRSVSHSCRHTCDYESGTRNGSMECRTYNVKGIAYGPHGHQSRDLFSIDDWVMGGAVNTYGWNNGNDSFNADHGYLILRPTMYGGDRGILACANSDGLRVIAPNIHTPGAACIKLEYAHDTVIDLRGGGILHHMNPSTGQQIWADGSDSPLLSTDITIYGTRDSFQGTIKRIQLALDATATATLVSVPSTVAVVVSSGLVDVGDFDTSNLVTVDTDQTIIGQKTLDAPKINSIRDTNNKTMLYLSSAGSSADNYFEFDNAVTGQPPTLYAWGSVDANVDGNLDAKGTGTWKLKGNPIGSKVGVPSTATSTGVVGQWAADASFLYTCTATNTWRRVAIASW